MEGDLTSVYFNGRDQSIPKTTRKDPAEIEKLHMQVRNGIIRICKVPEKAGADRIPLMCQKGGSREYVQSSWVFGYGGLPTSELLFFSMM